jgi:uncharacterized protein YraI
MRFGPLLIGFGCILTVTTGVLAKPAYVPSTLNLRAAPGTKSEIVGKIPGGSLVDAGECTEGWCELTFQDKKGFAKQSAIDLSGRVSARNPVRNRAPAAREYVQHAAPGPVYSEGPAEYAEPPTVYYAGPPRYYYYDRSYVPYYRRPWGWHRSWW